MSAIAPTPAPAPLAPVELVDDEEGPSPDTAEATLVLVEAPAAETHPVALYLARLAPGSRPVMLSALKTAVGLLSHGQLEDVRAFPWATLRYPHLMALRALLRERYAPATANRLLCAVRGVLKEAWRLGQLSTDDYQRARDVGGVGGSRLPAGRDVAMAERQRLLQVCIDDKYPARGARDAAMIAILSGTGVRRAEVVGLDVADVELDTGAVRVLGKGDKERRTYLVDGAVRALEWWLSLRGTEPGPMLTRVLRGGHIRMRRLQARAVAVVIERRIREAGLRDATAHDFRRTLTGDLLDAGADLATVQAILGHASPTTTARYDRRGERTRKKALELVKVPFSGKRREEVSS